MGTFFNKYFGKHKKYADGGGVNYEELMQFHTIRDYFYFLKKYGDGETQSSWLKPLLQYYDKMKSVLHAERNKENPDQEKLAFAKKQVMELQAYDTPFRRETVAKEYSDGGGVGGKFKFNIGDKVMVNDNGYVKKFEGFDITKPVTIKDRSKSKLDGKTYYFYQIETANGQIPFNNALEQKLTLANGEFSGGGKVGKTWIVSINDPGEKPGKYHLRKEQIVLGPASDEFDVKQAIIRMQHGSGGSFLGNGKVLSIVELKGDGGKLWIQEALAGRHKGALRATAKKEGLLHGKHDTLTESDLHKLEKMGGKTAKRAHLAETLKKFKK